jgi:hypothetical protein
MEKSISSKAPLTETGGGGRDQDPQSRRAKKNAPALSDERTWLVISLQSFYICKDKRPLETMLNEKKRAGNSIKFNSVIDTEKQRRALLVHKTGR